MKTLLLITALVLVQHTLAYDVPETRAIPPDVPQPTEGVPRRCAEDGYECTSEEIDGKRCFRLWCVSNDKPPGEDLRGTYCLEEEVS